MKHMKSSTYTSVIDESTLFSHMLSDLGIQATTRSKEEPKLEQIVQRTAIRYHWFKTTMRKNTKKMFQPMIDVPSKPSSGN